MDSMENIKFKFSKYNENINTKIEYFKIEHYINQKSNEQEYSQYVVADQIS